MIYTSVFSLSACGAKQAKTEAPVEVPAAETTEAQTTAPAYAFEAPDLVGTWQSPCFPSPQGDGSFNQLTFKMTESEWDLDYVAHGDENCTAKFLTVNIKGSYELGDSSTVAEGAREGTFGFREKTVTPHMEGAIGVINGACGVTETVVGTPLDLSAGCAGLGAYPIAECGADNDIVMVKDDVLYFGARPADNNMCTPEKRPTSFEGGAQVKKQ